MDDIQAILVKMVNEQPSCLNDRKMLKAVLLDYLPQNKLQLNLLLNAFDENIITRLNVASDVTLNALQMTKVLSDEYGIKKEAAFWTVISWCYILNLDTVAQTIETTSLNGNLPSGKQLSDEIYTLRAGTYKPGIDFQPGEICVINITENDNTLFGIQWGIGKNPTKIRTDADSHFFHDRVYLHVELDDYLKIEGPKNTTVTVQKVDN